MPRRAIPSDVERELKVPCADRMAVRRALSALGGRCKGEGLEHNVVFDTADGALRSKDVLLRLRCWKGNVLTYKGPRKGSRGKSKSRDEIEVELPVAQKSMDVLSRLGVPFEARVLSAHRSPEAAWEFAVAAERDFAVVIAIAGGAAALPGFISSATDLPVIAVPVATDVAGGLDSLLSGVQMPGGVPVLSTGTNSGGPVNAAVAAARIIALSDKGIASKLKEYRKELARGVAEKDEKVRRQATQR